MTDKPHGERKTYSAGCRCAACREANRLYAAEKRAQRYATPALADVAGHGKEPTYVNYGCRCDACRAAHTVYARTARARKKGS